MDDRDLMDELPHGLVPVPEWMPAPVIMVFKGPKYEVQFHRVQSARFKLELDEVAPYPTDLLKVITDNSVKDITTMEDKRILDSIWGTVSGAAKTALGISQLLSGTGI
jgi:hypothetical protein